MSAKSPVLTSDEPRSADVSQRSVQAASPTTAGLLQFRASLEGLPYAQQVQMLLPPMPVQLATNTPCEFAGSAFLPTPLVQRQTPAENDGSPGADETEDSSEADADPDSASQPPSEPTAPPSDPGDSPNDDPKPDAAPAGAQIQQRSESSPNAAVHRAAAEGVSGSGTTLPYLSQIQTSFGEHDVSGVSAHQGGAAATANAKMGSVAYATGNDVAFGRAPDLHTAAHEAAHIVQQRSGVSLKGGVGQVGDAYEQHADAVADRVVRGQSAAELLSAGPHQGASVSSDKTQKSASPAGSHTVQKAEETSPSCPHKSVHLSLAGRRFSVALPSTTKKKLSVAFDETIGGVKLDRVALVFDKKWKIKGGSVKGGADFRLAKKDCHADFKLKMGRGGKVKNVTSNVAFSGGVLSGTCKLKLGKKGVSGTAKVSVNGDVGLGVAGGKVQLGAGTQASAKLVNGDLTKLNLDRLKASVHDSSGKLLDITGKGSWTPKTFRASATASLARNLSAQLGDFKLTLKQGQTTGQVELKGSSIKKLTAAFAVGVSHKAWGELGTGTLNATYANDGKTITGCGEFTLSRDITLGAASGLHLIAAKAGDSVGVRVDKKGRVAVLLTVSSEVRLGERWLAKATAKNVVYDGASLSGDFDLRINTNFQFKVGPLTVKVTSNGRMGLSYIKGDLAVDGGDLDVAFEWNGKGFGLEWPNWSLRGPNLSPLPTLKLPKFDISGFFVWLRGLLPSGFSMNWLFTLIDRLRLKLPSFGGGKFPNLLGWLKGFKLPFPDPFPLLGLPNFDLNLVFGDIWGAFVDFFSKVNVSMSVPDLTSLFSELPVPNFNVGWFKGLFGGNLGLETKGEFDLTMDGPTMPTFSATDLAATLLNNGQRLATLAAPTMSYDGQTFKARIELTFEKGLGPKFGEYRVTLDKIGLQTEMTAGQPYKFVIPTLAIGLAKGDTKLATGTVGNVVIDETNGLVFNDANFGVQFHEKMPLGQAGVFSFGLQKGSAVTLGLQGGDLQTVSGPRVGVDIDKNGAPYAAAGITAFHYDLKSGLKQATADLALKQPLPTAGGLTLKKGAIKATIANNKLKRLDLAGLKGRFERSIAGKTLKLSGTVKSGTWDAEKDELTALDATVVLKKKFTVGAGKTKATLHGGSMTLVMREGKFESLAFADLDLSVRAGKLSLRGTATGRLDDDGLTLSHANATLKRAITFGSKSKQVKLRKGVSLGVVVEKNEFKSVSLTDLGVDVRAGKIRAGGTLSGSYDGENLSGSAEVGLENNIAFGTPKLGGGLRAGAALTAEIDAGELTSIGVRNATVDAQVQGVGLTGTLTSGRWENDNFSLDLDVSATPEAQAKGLQIGNLTLKPSGGSVHLDLKQGVLDRLDVKSFELGAVYAPKKGSPIALNLSFTNGSWTPAGLSGSATVTLAAALTVGPKANPVVVDGGSATVTMLNGQLTTLALAGLVGRVVRNNKDLATIILTQGSYDFVSGEITKADMSFAMAPGESLDLSDNVAVSGVFGSLKLDRGTIGLTAGASLTAAFGKDAKPFSGGIQVAWTQGPSDELGDFAGSVAKIAGTLIDDPQKGRFLGGELDVQVKAGNNPSFDGKLTYQLTKGIKGVVDLWADKKLDPIVKPGSSLAFEDKLAEGKKLLNLDMDTIAPGKKPKPGKGPVTFGVYGGLGLETKDLTAGVTITLDKEWRPLGGDVPDFTSKIGAKWGLKFEAELGGMLAVAIPVFPWLKGGASLKGGFVVSQDLDVEPTITLKGEGGALSGSFDLNAVISPQANAELEAGYIVTIDLAIWDYSFTGELAKLSLPLGALFEVGLNAGADFDESSSTPRESAASEKLHQPKGSQAQYDNENMPAERSGERSQGGQKSGGVLPGIGNPAKEGGKGAGMGGLGDLLEKAKAVALVAKGIKGVGVLASKIISGLRALVSGGPLGFIVWAVWEIITGGIGDIIRACKDIAAAMPALKTLIGDDLKKPELKWLQLALNILDDEADDKAREAVAEGKHKSGDMLLQASLIQAMYAGSCGDEDENAILVVMRDSANLESLLVELGGGLKLGIDQALYNLDGAENTKLRNLLLVRGLGHLIDIDDDDYARQMVAEGKYRDMTIKQRGAIVKMLYSGSCGDDDEMAVLKVLRHAAGRGQLASVLKAASGSVANGVEKLLDNLDGDEDDQARALLRRNGLGHHID